MKYCLQLSIDKPRSTVWQAFNDPERMKVWQPALSNVELLDGTRGRPGARSRLTYNENGREFSLVETITHRQELERLDQVYENQFASNTVINQFVEQGPDQTLWTTDTEYRFKTLLMRGMGPLYRKNFAARTQRDMERFKEMVEKE